MTQPLEELFAELEQNLRAIGPNLPLPEAQLEKLRGERRVGRRIGGSGARADPERPGLAAHRGGSRRSGHRAPGLMPEFRGIRTFG